MRKAVSRQETPLGKAIKIIPSIYPIRLRDNGEIEEKRSTAGLPQLKR